MKLLFTVLDGAAGRPNPELNGKTPLQAADTPALDKIGQTSRAGQMTVIPDTAPESDSAVIALLGYNPEKHYTGRGPLEAIGSGMGFEDGDLALRCNFATLKDNELIDRRVARSLTSEETEKLQEIINTEVNLDNTEFEFKSTLGHRGALIIKSDKDLSPKITNTDPAYGRKGLVSTAKEEYESKLQRCQPMEPEAKETAKIVNEFVQKTINALKNLDLNERRREEGKLPATAVITRDAGVKKPDFPDINKRDNGKWTILANMPLERGVAKGAGMSTIKVEDEEDYEEWINKTLEAMENNDYIYIHLKGPDLPGHDGKPIEKKEIIEEIDKKYYSKLLNEIDREDVLVSVTCDHSTPCTISAHSSDPVPVLMSHPSLEGTHRFVEDPGGELDFKKGSELMPYLMNLYRDLGD